MTHTINHNQTHNYLRIFILLPRRLYLYFILFSAQQLKTPKTSYLT